MNTITYNNFTNFNDINQIISKNEFIANVTSKLDAKYLSYIISGKYEVVSRPESESKFEEYGKTLTKIPWFLLLILGAII